MNLFSKYKIIFFIIIGVLIIFLGSEYFFNKKDDNQIESKAVSTQTATSAPVQVKTTVATSTSQNSNGQVASTSLTKEIIPVGTDTFIVNLNATSTPEVASNLLDQGFIQDKQSFISSFNSDNIFPGAYKLSKDFSISDTVKVLKAKPFMKWVVIPPGLRKEEIAGLLQNALGWSASQKKKFITVDTVAKSDYIEGVYFPNTYLIPVSESTSDVAKRLIAKFNENFSTYLPGFNAENVKWTSALTLASIVQREASGNADMSLIAGILWNRLNAGMLLSVDATLQYVRGDKGNGWWAPITTADKKTDSPFNTYLNKGLPPHPISNPGDAAIEATLNPTKTDCLYYLHDKNHVTHCAVTYEEHLQNIDTYLKN